MEEGGYSKICQTSKADPLIASKQELPPPPPRISFRVELEVYCSGRALTDKFIRNIPVKAKPLVFYFLRKAPFLSFRIAGAQEIALVAEHG